MLVAAVVILAGVVVVASGRGGELAATEPDYPPIDLGPVTSADVALLRPPSAAWGYNMRVTDEALEVIAKAVTERDVRIAALQQEVSDLRDQLGGGGRAATLDPPGGDLAADPAGGPAEGPAGDQEPTGPQIPEPDWPSSAEDTEAAGPAVPITRPQPIYHAEGQGEGAGQPEAPAQASAPWGPAEPPGQEPLWEPRHQPAADHAISWEAPETVAEHAPQEQAAEPGPGWSADPADTSPDATAVDVTGLDQGGETSLPVTPATGWRAQEQTKTPGQDQAQARAARPADAHEFSWDEDPHQQVVWGVEHARAKAAKATEEALPNAEHRDDDRG
jgi:uncharacterized small protein (DUF1192 family)